MVAKSKEGLPVIDLSQPIKVTDLTTREGDWNVLNLEHLTVSVTFPVAQYHSRKAEVVLGSPEGVITRVAVPVHAGAGPQPEGTITYQEITDMIEQLYKDIELVLAKTEKKEAW